MTGTPEKPGSLHGRFSGHRTLINRKFYLVISLFVVIALCLVALDRFQANVLNAVRAYVAGEGFWSKGQKDATYHLEHYAENFDHHEYALFLEGVSASLGDRQARLALQSTPPDIERARQGFLDGHNHPDDVDRLISLFLNFSEISFMKKAINTWTEGDALIDKLMLLGQALDAEVNSPHPDPGRIREIMAGVDRLDTQINALEERFSATLGDGARKIGQLTEWAVLTAALLLLTIGIILSRQIIRGIHQTQAKLVASEARFRHVVESNMIGIMFWKPDGSIIDANDVFLQIIGYTREELANGTIDWQKLTPDDGRERDEQAMAELENRGYCTPYEKEYLHRDGHRVAIYLGAARFDNQPDGGVCFVLDISERKRAEQARKLAATVFQAAKEAIIVTDSAPAIKAVNPAFTEITGYDSEDILNRNPNILNSGRHDKAFYQSMWKSLKENGRWKGEVWNRRKNGEIYQEWLSISAIYDDKGDISEYVGVFSDISEQRNMEEQLRQSQKMEAIGTLVGGIAHDFNNTLAAMKGNIYLAQKYNDNNAKVAAKLKDMDILSDHSADMVQQLMTFARKDIVQLTTLSLNELFREQQRLTDSIIPENIAYSMKLCDEELSVKGDRTQLQQILLNLLNNAHDAVAENDAPAVECRLERFLPDLEFRKKYPQLQSDILAHVTISDNGCGISEEQLAHIFEPFYTTKEVGKGTGLGMSMVYGSMQRHRGVIDVESTVGEGTSVHLYLPVEKVAAEVREPDMEYHEGEAAAEQRTTVLLVDDNVVIRTTCSESLNSMGYEVITAGDGIEAMECFARRRGGIDLVITDIVMPRMGGFKLAEQLRTQQNADLPVIFITGYDPQQATIPEALKTNSGMLIKPFSIDALLHQTHELLKRRHEA